MLNRDFEIVTCSSFVNSALWSCDMNSTLGSVVPLAMFGLTRVIIFAMPFNSVWLSYCCNSCIYVSTDNIFPFKSADDCLLWTPENQRKAISSLYSLLYVCTSSKKHFRWHLNKELCSWWWMTHARSVRDWLRGLDYHIEFCILREQK